MVSSVDIEILPDIMRLAVFVLHGRAGARRYALIDTGGQALLHLTHTQPQR